MNSISKRLKKIFSGASFDTAIIMNASKERIDGNLLYLSNFTSGVFEQDMIIATPERIIIITTPLEYEIAIRQKPREAEVIKVEREKRFEYDLSKHLQGRVVGIDESTLPYKYYKIFKKLSKAKRFVDASGAFSKAREVKDGDEIAKIRRAVSITKRALTGIPEYFQAGMKEKQLASILDSLQARYGADGNAFQSIVSFGANSAMPHHLPDNTRLKPNSTVLIDVGARYKNYCSDITRTFFFKPDKTSTKYKRMQRIYKIVENAQQKGIGMMREGVDGSDVYKEVLNYINKVDNGIYKDRFIHGLGHGIGLEVHDGLALSSTSKKLKRGMVTSCEPGIYIVGFGGVRIEDDVIVGKSRSTVL